MARHMCTRSALRVRGTRVAGQVLRRWPRVRMCVAQISGVRSLRWIFRRYRRAAPGVRRGPSGWRWLAVGTLMLVFPSGMGRSIGRVSLFRPHMPPGTSSCATTERWASGTASPWRSWCGWLMREHRSPRAARAGIVGLPMRRWPRSVVNIHVWCSEPAGSSKRWAALPRFCGDASAPKPSGWRPGGWGTAHAAGPRCGRCTRRSRLWITPAMKTACGTQFRRFCRPIPVGGLFLLKKILLVLTHLPKTLHRSVRGTSRSTKAALRATLRKQKN
ncbi:Uncharacterised protein [Mycobacteroides abscessus]|nr:Uncharacterised protein [Mycobacteroides abscessus]